MYGAMTTKTINSRDAEMIAVHLLTHPGEIGAYLHEQRWMELACLAEYIAADVPPALAGTDPALYRTLRNAVTEVTVMGFGNMDAAKLRKMAVKEPRHRAVLAAQFRARIEAIKAEDKQVKAEILAMENITPFASSYLRMIEAREQVYLLESLGLKADESRPTNRKLGCQEKSQ